MTSPLEAKSERDVISLSSRQPMHEYLFVHQTTHPRWAFPTHSLRNNIISLSHTSDHVQRLFVQKSNAIMFVPLHTVTDTHKAEF